MHIPEKSHNRLYDIVLLALATALLFGALLGGRPYSAPSESRYVEIGREMAESDNYITPRLNYVKYFEKPPLFYWVQAAWTEIAGVGFFESRVPTAFFTILICLLTYGLARLLYDRLAAVLASVVMATCLYTFTLSRIVLLDVPVSVFLVATLTAFLYAADAPPGTRRSLAIYSMYIAAAGAVLTKGLIGIVLPGAVIFLWLLCTGRWKLLLEMRLFTGTALFALITVPWHIVVWQHNPEHPWFYFVHEHWLRYTTTTHGRDHKVWFFVPVLLGGLIPWLVFTVCGTASLRGFWKKRKQDGRNLFLVLWVGFIFLFFSASDSTLIPYILPIFPPLAAITGHYLARAWREEKPRGFMAGIASVMLLLTLFCVFPMLAMEFLDADSKAAQAITQGGDALHYLSVCSLVGIITLFVVFIQGSAKHLVMAVAAIAVMIMQMGDLVAANYSKDSMQALTSGLKPLLKPTDEVVAYDNYPQDLPIYLERRITIVRWKGELEFGTKHEDTSAWMIDYEDFWKRIATPGHRMFVIMRKDAYERVLAEKNPRSEQLHLLMQDGRNLLFSNVTADELKQKTP